MAHTPTLAQGQNNIPAGILQDGQAPAIPIQIILHAQGRPVDATALAYEIVETVGPTVIVARTDMDIANFFPDGDKLRGPLVRGRPGAGAPKCFHNRHLPQGRSG